MCRSSCLLYRFLSLDSFPSMSGNDASCVNDNHLPRPCPTERVTPRHPDMAVCSGYDVREGNRRENVCAVCLLYAIWTVIHFSLLLQISVELGGRLPSAGDYVLVVEYSSEEELPQTLSVAANVPGARTHQHRLTLLHCKYRYWEDDFSQSSINLCIYSRKL